MYLAQEWLRQIGSREATWEDARESYRLTGMSMAEFKRYLKASAEMEESVDQKLNNRKGA